MRTAALLVATLIVSAALGIVLAVVVFVAVANAEPRHSHRYDVAQKMIRGLRVFDRARHIPMVGEGWNLEAEAHRYNVNPAVLAGLAAKEAELGRTAPAGTHNAYGIGPGESFPSWHAGNARAARLIRHYVDAKGARSVAGILAGGYCVGGCSGWVADVERWASVFGLGLELRYPRSPIPSRP